MSGSHEFIQILRNRGLRITAQRAIILDAFDGLSGHITAEEIFTEVRQINPGISLATVYRTLDLLEELGLVTQSNMGTPAAHYAFVNHGAHHHAICRNCSKSYDLPDDLFEPVVQNLRDQHDFEADLKHLVIFGTCPQCRN